MAVVVLVVPASDSGNRLEDFTPTSRSFTRRRVGRDSPKIKDKKSKDSNMELVGENEK